MLVKLNKFKGVLAVVVTVITAMFVVLSGQANAATSQSSYWIDSSHIKIGDSGMDTVTLGEIKAAIGSAQIDTQETGETSLKGQVLKFAAGGFVGNILASKVVDFVQGCKGCNDFYFSPTKTLAAGFPVFQDNNSKKQLVYPIFQKAPRVGVRWPSGNSEGNYSPPDSAAAVLTFEYEKNGSKSSTEKVNGLPVCSMEKYDNCWEKGNGGRAVKLSTTQKEKLEKTIGTFSSSFSATANDIKSGDCDAGALDFILCPITDLLNEVNEAIIGFITKGLVVQTGGFADDSSQLRQLFDKVLLLSNGLFALIFIIIVFGNTLSLGIDAYTIKKALPRLVIAVILAQFSYFIAGSIIEIGNVLSQGILALLSNQTLQVASLSSTVSGIASILLEITFLLISFVAVLVGIFVLAIRQIIIVGLMITGPLAFAAWVLPNTDKAFKFWFSNLVKLSMMGPIIVGMLAGSFVLKSAVDASGGNWIVQLGGAALPIIALLYLPKTFKWSGQLMSATGGKVAGMGTSAINKGVTQPIKGAAKDTLNDQRRNLGAKLAAGDSKLAQLGSGVVGGKLGASLPTRKGHAERLRMQANAAAEERKLEDAKMSVLSGPALHKEAEEAGKALARNPADIRAKARMESVLARAGAVSDMNAVARANNAFTSSMTNKVAANDAWGSALGNSGIMGDIKEKSPELSSVGTFSFDAAGSRSLNETWSVKDQGKHAGGTGTGTPNGVRIAVTNTRAIDLSGKNRSGLAGLSKDTVKSVATAVADPASRAAQLKNISIEEMGQLTDPRYAPKDPGAKEHWRKIADAAVIEFGPLAATGDPAAQAKLNAANQIIAAGW